MASFASAPMQQGGYVSFAGQDDFAPGGYGGAAEAAEREEMPLPAPAMPAAAPKPAMEAPKPKTLQEFAAQELRALQSSNENDPTIRATLLTALADRIHHLSAAWTATGEPPASHEALTDLATELSTPTTDPAEIDRRWQHAITILETLATDRPRRRAFWKR